MFSIFMETYHEVLASTHMTYKTEILRICKIIVNSCYLDFYYFLHYILLIANKRLGEVVHLNGFRTQTFPLGHYPEANGT